VKWRIAAEFAAQLPALYDHAFRPALGTRYDEVEQEVWIAMAKSALSVARTLSLPVNTPQDLAETMRMVLLLLFGPEYKSETLEVSKDGAVIIIRRCPLLSKGYDTGTGGERTFRKCMTLVLTGIPTLNKEYSARFVRTMCTGDRQCEIKVAKNETAPPGTPVRK
jgi:hypothetical protein